MISKSIEKNNEMNESKLKSKIIGIFEWNIIEKLNQTFTGCGFLNVRMYWLCWFPSHYHSMLKHFGFWTVGWKSQVIFYLCNLVSQITICFKGLYNLYSTQHPLSSDPRFGSEKTPLQTIVNRNNIEETSGRANRGGKSLLGWTCKRYCVCTDLTSKTNITVNMNFDVKYRYM